ncbi:LOW QUALITY PROTEIN: hypothetical protein JCM24511_00360 [Saitozyma sp. JCM 24511]|nr:LOW QUALITY PROTEIN: hypothetical protein JCM24511_00360 [Saitozyma sp. JCM 24511]
MLHQEVSEEIEQRVCLWRQAVRVDAGVVIGATNGADDDAAEGVERTFRSAAKPEEDEAGVEDEDGPEDDSARARRGARRDMAIDSSRESLPGAKME